MKFKIGLLLFILITGVFSGCSTHTAKLDKNTIKLNAAKEAALKNKLATQAKASDFVFATGIALNLDTNQSPALSTARRLNTDAGLTLGAPAMKDGVVLHTMVTNLVAHNMEGSRELSRRERDVIKLQSSSIKLEKQQTATIDTIITDAKDAAESADKWDRLMGWIRKICWAIGGFILIGVAVNVLSFVPSTAAIGIPLARLYNGLTGGVLGGIGSLVFKLLPSAQAQAGVVSATHHQALAKKHAATQEALGDVTEAIHEFRKSDSQAFETKLAPKLKAVVTTDESKKLVTAARLARKLV